ncbi:MAG: dihydrolipoyllysine-residue acetyltransferase [Candidatus Methylumidiphilus sp.]
MAKEQTIVVPDIGNNHDVSIIEVLVKVGDIIKPEDSLITLESDKAAMEIPSSHGGTVTAVIVKVGDKVSQGSPIVVVQEGAAAAAAAPAPVAAAPAPVAAPAPTPAAPAAPAVASEQTISVPDIGNNKDVSIIEVLVKPGDILQPEASIITLESDKAAMEIPTPVGGTVKTVLVKVGDKVSQGSPVLVLEAAAPTAQPSPAPVAAPAAAVAEPAAAPAAPRPAAAPAPAPAVIEDDRQSSGSKPHASPAVRRFARELGADVAKIKGTGPKGRILKEDVQNYIKARLQAPPPAAPSVGTGFNLPPAPEIDFSQFGPIEAKALSRIKKLSGANLHRNWVTIPHVTLNEEADITDLEAFRVSLKAEADKQKIRVTPLPFFIKAVVAALKAYPNFNASLSANGEELILKQYYHIGVAIDTPDGLVVPAVRNADGKSVFELARELGDLGEKARGKKLKTSELQGGTFTISSLGSIGSVNFTPIINAPEVAILGISKAQTKPVWKDGQFVPRLILPLSLSFDHRVIDGAEAAKFAAYLAQVLGDIRRVLL